MLAIKGFTHFSEKPQINMQSVQATSWGTYREIQSELDYDTREEDTVICHTCFPSHNTASTLFD